ncbi:hypothetical protein MIND_00189600 [Mycena indigotica]|uniref:DUF6534 domain-containing protein n=1 Tax=Mycena indigotica TaxID=2126181 RepID=A0A8H6WCU5_9AGAR|nr:uncharacterized protein MIND_00189600 [Mycena indigotica]KAF7311791.1 hypothetical protein MIND_00189600 [Mycena indigotica]
MSSSAPPGPPSGPPDVTALFGPLLLGALLNTLLYGVMAVQAFIYFNRYQKDRTWFKYLVSYLVLVETVNLVCIVGLVYEPLIVRYGRMEALITSPIMLRPDAVLTVLISAPTQLFVAWRLQVITHSYLLSGAIAILAVVAFGGGVAVSTVVSLHPDFASFPTFKPEVITWLVSSSACDVLLTASLVVSLWTRKSKVASTDSYVNKIIRCAYRSRLRDVLATYRRPRAVVVTVQTGLITAAAASLDMLLYVLIPNTSYNFILDFPLSKLYTNSLLSTLNARPWRESAQDYNAPNVLFEQSGRTGTSGTSGGASRSRTGPQTFSLVQTGTQRKDHMGLGSYQPSTQTATGVNVSVKTESFLDITPAPHPYGVGVDSKNGHGEEQYVVAMPRYERDQHAHSPV